MRDVCVVAACRTAIGNFGGAFAQTPSTDLASATITESLRLAGVDPGEVGEVIFGNAEGRSDAKNIARLSWLRAGLPVHVPGYSIDCQCGSGMRAIHAAVEAIKGGRFRVAVAGGVENLSRYRYVLEGARFGYRMGHGQLVDTLTDLFTDPLDGQRGTATAARLAARYHISREESDEFALLSHQRAVAAQEKFLAEIVPVAGRRGSLVRQDEHPRADATLDGLAGLPLVFPDNPVVTAGNASGICDGAAALVLADEAYVRERGLRSLGNIRAWTVGAVESPDFGIAPAVSIRSALRSAGLSMDAVDLWEINEAFAAQYIAVERELGLDRSRVNVNGGAIALGHPVGCSGARLPVTLLNEMGRRGARYGMASLCVGGGIGISTLFESS